ncbi:hypothetical protein, partial [Limnovirga soli]
MKNILFTALMMSFFVIAKAQVPQQLNYQGIARNATGSPIAYQNITVRLSIIDSATNGQIAYRETRRVLTNYAGLFNIVIGSNGATDLIGSVESVNWSTGKKYIKLEIDPNGLNNFGLAGITQLQSVAYALSATPSGNAHGDLSGTYPAPTIANNAITSNKIADGSVGLVKLTDVVVSLINSKLNTSDTATMLSAYASKENLANVTAGKLNISDTADMLSPYAKTAGINNLVVNKLNISDTAAMLSTYA